MQGELKTANILSRRCTKMKTNKGYIILGLMIALTLFFELAAHAELMDRSTKLTFSEPIQIPGEVLPAGTYLFRLADGDSGQHVVQIFNADGTIPYATVLTIATERPYPTGDTAVTLAKQGAGNPDARLKWFYPGCLTGNEFLYSKQKEKELAQDKQQTIMAGQTKEPDSDITGAGD
jgi:hypothetical protein